MNVIEELANMNLDIKLCELAKTTNDWQIIYSLLHEGSLVRMAIAGREIVDEGLAMFFANDADEVVRCALAANELIKFTDDLIMVLVHDKSQLVLRALLDNKRMCHDIERALLNMSYRLVSNVLEWDQVLRAVVSSLISSKSKILGMQIVLNMMSGSTKEMGFLPPQQLPETVIRVLTEMYYGYFQTATRGIIDDYLYLSKWHRNLSIQELGDNE